MTAYRNVLTCVAALILISAQCEATVELVITIHRHGARTVLFKNATSLAEGGALLTVQGENQTHAVGQQFRQRYLDPASCKTTCVAGLPGGEYDGTRVRSLASGFDRTLASAQGFLQGVFPAAATDTFLAAKPIPVFSVAPGDDFMIRAYDNCPAYLTQMNAWFESEEFTAKEQESAQLLSSLQESLNKTVELNNFWNIFDDLNTQRDAILTGVSSAPLSAEMQNGTWAQVVALADWLEANRYRRSLTQNLLGGTLLHEIIVRLQARKLDSQPEAERVIEYSAHYPTQLSLLSAMDLPANATLLNKGIPNYAAQVIIELHSDGAQTTGCGLGANGCDLWAVRMMTQDGEGAPYMPVLLPCAGAAAESVAGVGACTLDDFLALMQPQVITTQGAWCTMCKNKVMDACIAISAQPNADNLASYVYALNKTSNAYYNVSTNSVDATAAPAPAPAPSGGEYVTNYGGKIAGTAVACFVGGALIGAAVMGLLARRRAAAAKHTSLAQEAAL